MLALNRKLLRDLWHFKGQVVAISLVLGIGVVMFIAYLSAFDSLQLTRSAYYEHQRFANVFASLKRAPWRLRNRIAEIPGVAQIETRVVVDVTLDVEGLLEPATGRLISIPGTRRAMLNDLVLRRGRYIDANRPDEAIVNEGFALAHGLQPGDTIRAIINGRRRDLEIVGFGLSPEFVYTIRAGELIPDDARFGVFWMEQRALSAAYDMEGGFNDISLSLMPGANEQEVIARVNDLIEPYGGLGAIPRALQLSHWSVDNELRGLQTVGFVIPLIFMSIAAFLLNVALTRIVLVQREQIAVLKALGYANRSIAWHYTKWALAIGMLGAVVGTVGGVAIGTAMLNLYNQFFRFPVLEYQLLPSVVLGSVGIGFIAAVIGTTAAVRCAVTLPPAEAMRPQPPARYRVSFVERIGLQWLFSQASRIILRNIQRQPVRALTSIAGIAFSLAMLIVGTFMIDSLDVMMDVQFNVAQRQDVTITFVEPASARSFYALQRLPGVVDAEPLRVVPARLSFESRARQLAIIGLPAATLLNRVVDVETIEQVTLPPDGLVLSAKLAEILEVERGDTIRVDVLEGRRPVKDSVVSAVVDQFMGTAAYMEIGALHGLMREGGNLSGGYLAVDSSRLKDLYQALKMTPAVAGITLKGAALKAFEETFAKNINIMIFFNVLFASIIAFGVVYNAARVSLSERSHELASLRVLGFTRSEISSILLGELALLTLLSLPLGMLIGYGLSTLIVQVFETELYKFPLVAHPRTYTLAMLAILVASAVSGLIVRRRLDRLNLVEVLKTRE